MPSIVSDTVVLRFGIDHSFRLFEGGTKLPIPSCAQTDNIVSRSYASLAIQICPLERNLIQGQAHKGQVVTRLYEERVVKGNPCSLMQHVVRDT
jgi:hypothetical protein